MSFVVTFCCSLLSKEVFEGAEGNLLRIFEKNRSILYRIKELPLDEPQPKERYDLNSLAFPLYFLLIFLVMQGKEVGELRIPLTHSTRRKDQINTLSGQEN